MKILFLYTKRMLAANKARTAVTFAGIVLSFALLTAVLTGTSSLFHFFSEYMKMRDGDYYGVIYNCDEEDEARLAQSGEVMQICRMGIVGVAEKNFGIEHEVSLSNRVLEKNFILEIQSPGRLASVLGQMAESYSIRNKESRIEAVRIFARKRRYR